VPRAKKSPEVWTLEHPERPNFGMNKERTVHHMKRAKIVKEWREAFCQLALDAKMPVLEKVEVIVQPYVLNARYGQDVAFGCAPLAKAAIDGIVDAGVLIDDNPKIVVQITFLAPEYGKDSLAITVVPVE
jgi:hypothetical protein